MRNGLDIRASHELVNREDDRNSQMIGHNPPKEEYEVAQLSANNAGSMINLQITNEDALSLEYNYMPYNKSDIQQRVSMSRIRNERADNEKIGQIKTQQSSRSPTGSMIYNGNMSNNAEPAHNKVHTQMMGTQYSKHSQEPSQLTHFDALVTSQNFAKTVINHQEETQNSQLI